MPVARHRKAWALEATAPRTRAAETPPTPEPKPREARRILPKSSPVTPAERRSESPLSQPAADVPREILVVASRLKEYVRKRSGFNTSERVLAPLSDILREVVDEAIHNAARDERKTILDRDVPKPRAKGDR